MPDQLFVTGNLTAVSAATDAGYHLKICSDNHSRQSAFGTFNVVSIPEV
jgi:hypothetical protein